MTSLASETTDSSHQPGEVEVLPLSPPPLKPRSHLRVLSPAGPVDREALERGVKQLRRWGYRVSLGRSALKNDRFLAGTDNERFLDLWEALTDPEVDGIICSRGGYGTMRLLPLIPWDTRLPPKFFLGFSDIGALQVNLLMRWGWVTFSGPQVASGLGALQPDHWAWQHLRAWMEGKPNLLTDESGRPICLQPNSTSEDQENQHAPNRGIEGRLLPICLSILTALVGTPFSPHLSGTLLVLEEVNEAPYRIDRMLWQLAQWGEVSQARGIILGNFFYQGREISDEVAMMVAEHFPHLPVWKGLPYGHSEHRLTLPMGLKAQVEPTGRFSIDIPQQVR